jgi:type II secretion system protein I
MKSATDIQPPAGSRAFTLIEVMVATAIFFVAMFAILGVLSSGIHAASLLRSSGPTAGMIAAQYYATNSIDEGSADGDFSDVAGYEKYRWESAVNEVTTNGLYHVEIAVIDPNGNQSSHLDLLLYKPQSGGNRLGLQPQR